MKKLSNNENQLEMIMKENIQKMNGNQRFLRSK